MINQELLNRHQEAFRQKDLGVPQVRGSQPGIRAAMELMMYGDFRSLPDREGSGIERINGQSTANSSVKQDGIWYNLANRGAQVVDYGSEDSEEVLFAGVDIMQVLMLLQNWLQDGAVFSLEHSQHPMQHAHTASTISNKTGLDKWIS